MKTCAFCKKPSQGRYTIHRDGFGVGPEVSLCNRCGGGWVPSVCEIWNRIAKPSTDVFAHKPIKHKGAA